MKMRVLVVRILPQEQFCDLGTRLAVKDEVFTLYPALARCFARAEIHPSAINSPKILLLGPCYTALRDQLLTWGETRVSHVASHHLVDTLSAYHRYQHTVSQRSEACDETACAASRNAEYPLI